MKKPTEYRTKDFNESAFLYASGIKLLRFNGSFIDSKLCVWFIFEDKEKCESLVRSFWDRTAMVDAKSLCDSLRTIRDLLYKVRRGEIKSEEEL